MKLTLWKDNQRKEAKPFEIGVPILPRFFLVTTQSGVKSMSLSLDGARERQIATGHCIVECVAAVWTYKYNNGYTVTLRGALSAHVIITSTSAPGSAAPNPAQPSAYTFKFDEFTFDANFHDKFIALDAIMGQRIPEPAKSPWIRSAPTPNSNGTVSDPMSGATEEDKKWEEPRVVIERCSIPGEPVNAFGIPQATMRCLEVRSNIPSSKFIYSAHSTVSRKCRRNGRSHCLLQRHTTRTSRYLYQRTHPHINHSHKNRSTKISSR